MNKEKALKKFAKQVIKSFEANRQKDFYYWKIKYYYFLDILYSFSNFWLFFYRSKIYKNVIKNKEAAKCQGNIYDFCYYYWFEKNWCFKHHQFRLPHDECDDFYCRYCHDNVIKGEKCNVIFKDEFGGKE